MMCDKCKFWESRWNYLNYSDDDIYDLPKFTKDEYISIGMCRRYPPVPIEHNDDQVGFDSFEGNSSDFFEFPVTQLYDWCGEFKPKKKAPQTKP